MSIPKQYNKETPFTGDYGTFMMFKRDLELKILQEGNINVFKGTYTVAKEPSGNNYG